MKWSVEGEVGGVEKHLFRKKNRAACFFADVNDSVLKE